MEQVNHWGLDGFCYWESELSTDEDGRVWINVGYHLPLLVDDVDGVCKVLAVSGYTYAQKFS